MNTTAKTTTKCRSFLFATLLLLLCSTYMVGENFANDRKKEINKSFSVGSGDQVYIDNRYGNITVTHWNKEEVAIQVVIEAKARNESRLQQLLDRVTIELDKSGNTVKGITSLKNLNMSGNNEQLTINYYISMPSRLTSHLSQRYGSINLPDTNEGKCTLEMKYGNINAGSFSADLSVEGAYGDIRLGNVNTALMDLAYCGKVYVKDGAKLTIDSKYSTMELKNIQELTVEAKYGNLKAERVKKATVDLSYTNGEIAYVENVLTVEELSYGTLKVRELSSDFTHVAAEARYGNLTIGVSSKASFKISAEDMKYGNFDVNGFNAQTNKVDNAFQSTVNGGGNRTINFEGGNYSNLKINAL